MGELPRLCEPRIGDLCDAVVTRDCGCGLNCTDERRCDNQVQIDLSKVMACEMHLLHSGWREMEPGKIAVDDMVGICGLAVADEEEFTVHGSQSTVHGS